MDITMTSAHRQELFSARASAGSRTYFFDVKLATDGTRYLVINESREAGQERKHDRVMVFEEHLRTFLDGLGAATEFLGISEKAYSIDEIRREHPRAYEPWTEDEDQRLRVRYKEGSNVPELARLFMRKESAIRSRLSKLGLDE
jgi:hypothetical protein